MVPVFQNGQIWRGMKSLAKENKKTFLSASSVPRGFHIRQICGDTVENTTQPDKTFKVIVLKHVI